MKNRFNSLSKTKDLRKKEPPRRPKSPRDGWFYLSWEAHTIVMNERPIWHYDLDDYTRERMKQILFELFLLTGVLPNREALLKALRWEDVKEDVRKIFTSLGNFAMTEVDYEIGIRFALNFLAEPPVQPIPDLQRKAKSGLVDVSYLISNYYTDYSL